MSVLRTVRQPRYATLAALMLLIAIGCVAAGTWQIARYEQKRQQNQVLRANAKLPLAEVGTLLPLVGYGGAPARRKVEFRQVRVTGAYDEPFQTLVRGRTVDDVNGFLVVTPLRTSGGTLLVARGFVAQPASGAIPTPAAAPGGRVTISARVQVPEARNDAAGQLTDAQVESINPGDQATRLGGPVYNGYLQLEAHQPGSRGLTSLPRPDLSNPAGGALEPQHFAYVIQWYLFAALALAAPFAMARAETRQRRTREFDAPVEPEPADDDAPDVARARKLAERYGRPLR